MKTLVFCFMILLLFGCKVELMPHYLTVHLEEQTWEWQYTVPSNVNNDTIWNYNSPHRFSVRKERREEPTEITYVFLIDNEPVATRTTRQTNSDGNDNIIILANDDDDDGSFNLHFPSPNEINSNKFFIVGFPFHQIHGQNVSNYFLEVKQ